MKQQHLLLLLRPARKAGKNDASSLAAKHHCADESNDTISGLLPLMNNDNLYFIMITMHKIKFHLILRVIQMSEPRSKPRSEPSYEARMF